MSAACRPSPTPSTTPSRSWARPTSRCRTTTGATGRRRRRWGRWPDIVIARSEATKQSSFLVAPKLDCFASLAMTGRERLPPLQHDLAARLAALQQRMGALQVRRIDHAKRLVQRGAQHALVDEVGDVVKQMVLRDHV